MDLNSLDLKGKILLVTVPNDEEANNARAMLSEAYDDLAEAGCVFSMIVTPDVKLEAIDEEQMAMHGWFRK